MYWNAWVGYHGLVGVLPRVVGWRTGVRPMDIGDRIRVEIDLSVRFYKGSVGCVSCCPALDVYSQGDTKEEALSNLREAVQLFISSCYERGTLADVLKDSGFIVSPDEGAKPESIVEHGSHRIATSVPLTR